MQKKIIGIVLLFGTISARAELGHLYIPQFQPSRIQLGLEAQSFRSSSNYKDNGSVENLPSKFKLQTYDLLLNSMVDISDEWAISADLAISYAESYNNIDFRNSRRIKDLKLGIFRLYEFERIGQLIFDSYYLINFVDNGVNHDEVSVNDGVSWLQLGVWWLPQNMNVEAASASGSKPISPFRAYLGFRSRSNYSDLLVYKLQAQFKKNKYIYGGELSGLYSIFKEGDGARVEKALLNQRYNASIQRYNAWNPNSLEVLLWGGYKPNVQSQMRFGVSQVLGFQNVANGFGFFADWQISMEMTPTGVFFSELFTGSKSRSPKKNTDFQLKDYGPDPKKTIEKKKVEPSELQDL